jgi:hypothetical protein
MYRHFRSVGALALVVCLFTFPMTAALAKRSGAAKHAKSKDQSRGKDKKTSKKSSRNERHARNKKSRRESERVAKRSKANTQQNEGGRERASSTANQSETALSPNQARSTESSNEQYSQDPIQSAPAPRAVISSIPVERVAEIQTALIKQGYLDGEASGIYDDNTKAAMKKFQTANNLQTTGLPSAHTLKRLGVVKRGNSLSQVPVKTKSDVDKEDHQ